MSDIKLFRVTNDTAIELESHSVALEKIIQNKIEKYMDSFLGVRFLASEYITGKTHNGRIDSLGIDENNCPIIIEYKRKVNECVTNQGLYYLDWLLDHKAEFIMLVMDKYGKEIADEIDWSGTRLLCIAEDFTKYDEHAVNQIPRNIELIRFKHYGEDLLLFELINSYVSEPMKSVSQHSVPGNSSNTTVEQKADNADQKIKELYDSLKSHLLALGDDVQVQSLKKYYAFKRIKNFACIYFKTDKLVIYVKVDPDSVKLRDGFTRDVRDQSHHFPGTLEITIRDEKDLEDAKALLSRSYEEN
jgi:predicted transport protein